MPGRRVCKVDACVVLLFRFCCGVLVQRSWALSLPNLGVLFRMIGEHSFPLLAHLVSNLVGTCNC